MSLSGFVTFELLDRGIHREAIQVLRKNLTLYTLRVRHRFGERTDEVRLILTGVWGSDVLTAGASLPEGFSGPLTFAADNLVLVTP